MQIMCAHSRLMEIFSKRFLVQISLEDRPTLKLLPIKGHCWNLQKGWKKNEYWPSPYSCNDVIRQTGCLLYMDNCLIGGDILLSYSTKVPLQLRLRSSIVPPWNLSGETAASQRAPGALYVGKVTELSIQEQESNSYWTLGSQNQMVTVKYYILAHWLNSKRVRELLLSPNPLWCQDISVSTHQESWGCQRPTPHSRTVTTPWGQQFCEHPTLRTAHCHSPWPHIMPQLPGAPTLRSKEPELKTLTSNLST